MSSNPNNAVGTNGAFDGRTSVNAFNDGIAGYSAGILSGWACEPDSGLTVVLGGDGNTRDVAIAEDNAGNKTTINNISGAPISVTIGAAPNNNSRIDLIVAYVDNPPTGSSTATDNYGACGLIVVAGTASATPVAPNDSAIRTAITNDGASGTTAYYVILAQITIESGTTDLSSDNIQAGPNAGIGEKNIDFTTLEVLSGDVTAGTTTLSQITNGKWLFFAYCTVLSSGAEKAIELYKNNVNIQSGYFGNNLSSVWGNIVIFTVIEKGDSDVFELKVTTSSTPETRSRWIAIRLGAATVVN